MLEVIVLGILERRECAVTTPSSGFMIKVWFLIYTCILLLLLSFLSGDKRVCTVIIYLSLIIIYKRSHDTRIVEKGEQLTSRYDVNT